MAAPSGTSESGLWGVWRWRRSTGKPKVGAFGNRWRGEQQVGLPVLISKFRSRSADRVAIQQLMHNSGSASALGACAVRPDHALGEPKARINMHSASAGEHPDLPLPVLAPAAAFYAC